jgi:hypothetical protein
LVIVTSTNDQGDEIYFLVSYGTDVFQYDFHAPSRTPELGDCARKWLAINPIKSAFIQALPVRRCTVDERLWWGKEVIRPRKES